MRDRRRWSGSGNVALLVVVLIVLAAGCHVRAEPAPTVPNASKTVRISTARGPTHDESGATSPG